VEVMQVIVSLQLS